MEPTPKDTVDMPNTKNYMLLELAEGSIQAGPEQQERLDEITDRLKSGEFHAVVDERIPSHCIDGRPGAETIGVNSAGGTESLFVADDLTTKDFASADGTTVSGFKNVVDMLVHEGLPSGGHDDNHAEGDASGCGANDKLPLIYQFIASHGDDLRALATTLGMNVSDATHNLIVGNAGARQEFSKGAELLAVLRSTPGATIDHLQGAHKEVVAVINTVLLSSLDREALAEEFGHDYQAFNIDAWSFEESATQISHSPVQIEQKAIALAYYNLATAHVLCGPSMRVVVR